MRALLAQFVAGNGQLELLEAVGGEDERFARLECSAWVNSRISARGRNDAPCQKVPAAALTRMGTLGSFRSLGLIFAMALVDSDAL